MSARAVPLVPPLPKDNLVAGISLRNSSSKAEAEASLDVPDLTVSSPLSPRAVIIKHLAGALFHLFQFDGFERPLIFGPTVLVKVTFRVSLDCVILGLTASKGLPNANSSVLKDFPEDGFSLTTASQTFLLLCCFASHGNVQNWTVVGRRRSFCVI